MAKISKPISFKCLVEKTLMGNIKPLVKNEVTTWPLKI